MLPASAVDEIIIVKIEARIVGVRRFIVILLVNKPVAGGS